MKPLIIANWKCNPITQKEAKKLFGLVKKGVKNIKKVEVVICPPFLYLSELSSPLSAVSLAHLKIGAQDCFWEQQGAFTGEISPFMLKDSGCQYVIVGHSERRRYFGETDEIINKKLKAVIEAKLTPILCVGETQEQRDRGETENILERQIGGALKNISKFKINPPGSKQQNSKFSIAYEPVWAIGTGKPCDVEEAQKMGLVIRKIISKIYNQTVSKKLRLLYGGSVNNQNGAGYIKESGFQGLLVGGASLKHREFIDLIKKSR